MALGLTTSKTSSATPHASALRGKMSETPAWLKATQPMRARRTLMPQENPHQNNSTQHHAKRVEVGATIRPNAQTYSTSHMRKNQRISVNVNFAISVSFRVTRNATVRNRRRVANAENTATTNSSVDGDRSQLHQPQQ